MSPLVRTLLRLLPVRLASRLRLRLRLGRRPASRAPGEPADRWSCLELPDHPVPALRTARELVVGRPAELTLDVLAAAPELAAVVLPPHGWLPRAVVAELARRGIATVWRLPPAEQRLPPAEQRLPRRLSAARSPAAAGCTVNRRGPGS